MRRLTHLDMLRGLAAIGVVIGHVRGFVVVDYGAIKDVSVANQAFYSVTSLGHQCVIAFFALSGFLVGGPALRNIFAGDWHWPRYTLRRLTRLWIVLIPALLLTFAVDTAGETIGGRFGYEGGFHKLLHSGPSAGLPADLSVTTFVANVFFLQTIVTPTFGTNGPLWSLANEYWYYVLFPLLIIGLFGRSKDVIQVTMGLVGIALVVLLPIEMVLLGLIWIAGAVANWSFRIVSRYNVPSMWPFWFALCLTVIALAIALDKAWPGVPADLCLGVAFAATLIVLTLLPPFGSIYNGAAAFLAKISYTLYATHFPVLAFIWFVVFAPNKYVFGQAALGLCGFLFVTTILVATGMWWLFERNTERVRNVLETLLLGREDGRSIKSLRRPRDLKMTDDERDNVIEPSRRLVLPAALMGGAGVAGLLADQAKADTLFTAFPFKSRISNTATNSKARTDPDRWSDVINVLDFGADPTASNDSTVAIQNAINSLSTGNAGRGSIFFPPGNYKVAPNGAGSGSSAIQLGTNSGSNALSSIVIRGCGGATFINSTNGFNGFIFDSSASSWHGGTSTPIVFENMQIKNPYIPGNIFKNVNATGTWSAGAGYITIPSIPANMQAGAILFDAGIPPNSYLAAGGVPGYLGFVSSISGTMVNIGDPGGGGISVGAQLPSSSTGTTRLIVNQGFFAAATWTTSSTTITMAISNPGVPLIDPVGQFIVYDWTWVTSNKSVTPKVIGITSSAGWSGTTVTLTNPAMYASVTASDLLFFAPLSGCIRHTSANTSRLQSMHLYGYMACTFDQTSIFAGPSGSAGPYGSGMMQNCTAQCSVGSAAAIGTMGIYLCWNSMILDCDIVGFWNAVRMVSNGCGFWGGRVEVCGHGMILGGMLTAPGAGHQNTGQNGFVIGCTSFEGNWISDVVVDGTTASDGLITSFAGLHNHKNSTYGICLSAAANVTVMNVQLSGSCWNPSFQGGGVPCQIFVPDSQAKPGWLSFISCYADNIPTGNATAPVPIQAWRMPTKAVSAQFFNSNNPAPIFTFAKLPQPINITAGISNGSGSAGYVLVITAYVTGGLQPLLGSGLSGLGVTPGTIITSNTAGMATYHVNISQFVAAGTAMTAYPMMDGDSYLISNSQVPPAPIFAANGAISTSSPTITMAVANPGYITAGMTVFDLTNNKPVGTVSSWSGTTLTLTGNAANASSGTTDQLTFAPFSNAGTIMTSNNTGGGGGIYTVRVRWSQALLNWVMV